MNWDEFVAEKDYWKLMDHMEIPKFYIHFSDYVVRHYRDVRDDLIELYSLKEKEEGIRRELEASLGAGRGARLETELEGRLIRIAADKLSEEIRTFREEKRREEGRRDAVRIEACKGICRVAKKLAELITSEKIGEEEFFNLALGMKMKAEDAECFLQKVFLRASFNPFNRRELIVYICLKYSEGGMREMVDRLHAAYQAANNAAESVDTPEGENGFCTEKYMNRIDRELAKIRRQMAFDSQEEVIERLRPLFREVTSLLKKEGGHAYTRTANKEFCECYEAFLELCSPDIDEMKEAAVRDKQAEDDRKLEAETWGGLYQEPSRKQRYSEGRVTFTYDTKKGFSCRSGQCVCTAGRRQGGEKLFYLMEDVDIPGTESLRVEIPVECREETPILRGKDKKYEIGYLDAQKVQEGSIRITTTAPLTDITIEGTFQAKAPGGSLKKAEAAAGGSVYTKITGTLSAVCSLSLMDVIPAGTEFRANGFTYVSLSDVPVSTSEVTVGIWGTQTASRGQICALLSPEEFPNGIRVRNDAKVSYKNDGNLTGWQTTGVLNRYLYCGELTENFDYLSPARRQKLWSILEGTNIDFNNLPRRAGAQYPTRGNIVSRTDLMTMVFLREMANQEVCQDYGSRVPKSRAERMARATSVCQNVNDILRKAGYCEVFPENPYDGLLLHITSFQEEPLSAFRNLWANYRE